MKRIILFIFLFTITIQTGFSQKEDFFWVLGYDSDTSSTNFGGTNIDFNVEPPDIYYEFRDMNFDITNSSICDSMGNLLFYTNGIAISSYNGEIMENGEGLNPDPFTDDWIDEGYPLYQGTLILPQPESSNLYYLFHEEYSWTPNDPNYNVKVFTLYYTLIDISANNGLGVVIEKNIPVIQDTIDYGKITATKHANGIDWWILIPEFDSNKYYRILFTENGVTSIDSQEIGDFVYAGLGQAVFSPNGNKYVRYILKNINVGNFLNIYDFDRCTGLLSNPEQYSIIDTAYAGGVAISPNSRYLYVPSFGYTYQYDLEADDVEASKDTVAIYDGFVDIVLPTTFFLAQLAPDDKIYINSNNSVRYLHVIHNPNEQGGACNFEQHGIDLPTFNAASLPNFPNYRLGPVSESDTCELVNNISIFEEVISNIQIYPNPTYDIVTIYSGQMENAVTLKIYNDLGQEVITTYFDQFLEKAEININPLFPGVYYWEFSSINGNQLGSGKLIKMNY